MQDGRCLYIVFRRIAKYTHDGISTKEACESVKLFCVGLISNLSSLLTDNLQTIVSCFSRKLFCLYNFNRGEY